MNLPYIWPSIAIVAICGWGVCRDYRWPAKGYGVLIVWAITMSILFASVFLVHTGLEWAGQ